MKSDFNLNIITTLKRLLWILSLIGVVSCTSETSGLIPIPGPTDGLTASPSALSFVSIGTVSAQTVRLIDGPTGGAISERDTCGSSNDRIVVGTQVSSSSDSSFLITPQLIGSCVLTFTNIAGASSSVAVAVKGH